MTSAMAWMFDGVDELADLALGLRKLAPLRREAGALIMEIPSLPNHKLNVWSQSIADWV